MIQQIGEVATSDQVTLMMTDYLKKNQVLGGPDITTAMRLMCVEILCLRERVEMLLEAKARLTREVDLGDAVIDDLRKEQQ